MPTNLSPVRRWALAGLILTLGVGCSTTDPILAPQVETAQSILCLSGCIDPDDDPNPDSAGVWVGEDFSASSCLGGEFPDEDADGVGDQCEWVIARRFAPVMIFDAYDEVGRQPYFAVRSNGDSTLVILYMPAYYLDLGCSSIPLCGTIDDGHLGDSEAIGVLVYWNPSSQHWLTSTAVLSAHTSYRTLSKGGNQCPAALEYPNESCGRFMVHVAYGKHANYETRSACNNSSADYCNNGGSTGDTLFTEIPRNIGSYDNRFVDCVYSLEDPTPSYQECFWTGYPSWNKFFGWHGPNGDGSSPHSARLEDFGFFPL